MEDVIKAEGLSKSYGSVKAIQNLSLSVKRGEVFGLLGPNGAGKSTAIECMVGTRKQDSGVISILGKDPQKERKTLFEKVGVQFQESSCQEKITVQELCEEISSLYKSPADYKELLKKFGISDKLKSQVNDLSGGQKQRLSIVQALIPNPQAVFLDELTTGLDPKARREVWKCLADMKSSGLAILLTSHFMDEVENLCDRIMILKKGIAVFHGTVKGAIETSPYEKLEDAYLWYADEEGEFNEGI